MKLFLSSRELINGPFLQPNEVLRYRKVTILDRILLEAEIERPVSGKWVKYPGHSFGTVYLLSKWGDELLNRLDKFPIHVFVYCRVPDGPTDLCDLSPEHMHVADWATLFDNFEDAKAYKVESGWGFSRPLGQ